MNLRKWGNVSSSCRLLGTCGLWNAGASSNRVVYTNFDDADGFCSQIRAAFDQKAKADGIEVTYLDAKGQRLNIADRPDERCHQQRCRRDRSARGGRDEHCQKASKRQTMRASL